MDNSNLLVGLDIGTTSIKAVVSDSGNVIGAVKVSNTGMRHGKIVDIDQTALAIKKALKEIEQKINTTIYRVVTGIPVGMLQLETASDMINIGDSAREIEDIDVKRALQTAINSAVKNEREPIAFLPSRFLIDGKADVDDPRKMIAHSLAVHGILLTAPSGALHNVKKAIERAGYQNDLFIPAPLAIASSALTESERTFGSVLLDLGGGITTATIIHDGQIKYANIDFEGGSDISNDISVVLSISKKDAEQLKFDYGFADPSLTSKKNQFAVNSVGAPNQKIVDETYLSQIINARMLQIIDRIGNGLAKHNGLNLPGGIVITGGNSLLQGTAGLVAQRLGVKTRIFQPTELGIHSPEYAAAYGIVNYVAKMSETDFLVEQVIYGNEALTRPKDKKVQKNNKVSNRIVSISETREKEAYNRDELPREKKSSDDRPKKTKQKKGIKNLFKKFFD
ncbi:cell division protein FtsA [Lactobacillus sp. ESL0791]|uniref:cell division protein FtsA n=1 Tax=Lactobacillus sp. ESL0791 TaxID=2983234 RepID=UPI0023F8E12A|nr:cell division protein FtsA [Lactobacillus sp. ESL0791]MDF7638810.1 cell division protein FtsA [Lactobacillus sp. ESL0791]